MFLLRRLTSLPTRDAKPVGMTTGFCIVYEQNYSAIP